MRFSSSWMVARVAASGMRDAGLLATCEARAGVCAGVDLAGAEFEAELPVYGAGGGEEATFLAHPLKAPHSTVTAKPAQSRDFMNYPPITKHTRKAGVANIPLKQYS